MKAFLENAVTANSFFVAATASAASQSAEVRLVDDGQFSENRVALVENAQVKKYTAEELEEMTMGREIAERILPISRLVKLAEKSPPPQSWYDEEDLPF